MAEVTVETRDVSEDSVLVQFPDMSETDANAAAVALSSSLAGSPIRGLRDAIPGARTLFLLFDPAVVARDALRRRVHRSAQEPPLETAESRLFRIPVAYGGDDGPDLATLARDRGVDEEEFVRRHSSGDYFVGFLGFSPGFAYLRGMPPELAAPRRDTPRPRVPPGSVAIGGPYTAVYPSESPGGWRLIGRSPVRLFDPLLRPPALLRPGDRVHFERIHGEELRRRLAAAPAAAPPPVDGDPVFAVISPGLFTSVQGAPRFGLGSFGVPAGGAMDASALARGNAIVGNRAGAAALEMTLSGPELRALDGAVVCLAGADLGARWNGKLVEVEAPFEVHAGDHLAFGYARTGARGYLCVAGGLVERRSGEPPRRFARGDVVSRARDGRGSGAGGGSSVGESRDDHVVRVLPGPQANHFPESAWETFCSSSYRVSPESDRRGIRLDGPAIESRGAPDIPPEGTAQGAVQVPASGLPIVLGPDRPVTGGYAKIATVVGPDWKLLAQARPGTAIRFRRVSLGEAAVD